MVGKETAEKESGRSTRRSLRHTNESGEQPRTPTRMPMTSSSSSNASSPRRKIPQKQQQLNTSGNQHEASDLNSSEENLDDALICYEEEDDLLLELADQEANEQVALKTPKDSTSVNHGDGVESRNSNKAPDAEDLFYNVSGIDSDDAIELSGDEEPPQNQDVSLVCLKRPLPVEKVVECLDILESDEEFPVCVRPPEKVETLNVEEKTGHVKELIENEGLALIHSQEFGLVLFHMENVWIEGEHHNTGRTRELLPVGSAVSFYDRSFEGAEFRFLCPEQILQQAVIVWAGARPSHLLKTVEGFDEPFWKKQKDHRDTFLLYLRGEVFLRTALVRVKGKVMGYLSPQIGIIEVQDEDSTKQNVVFHEDDVRIFRRDIHYWKRDVTEILPVGLAVSVDAMRIHIPGVENLVYQAICVLAGPWPSTPYPTLLPGGAGSYAPSHDLPPGQFTFFYLELALESRLKRKMNVVKELLARTQGHPCYEWRGVRVIRNKHDTDNWRQIFDPKHRPHLHRRTGERPKIQVTHAFKPPPVRRFKTKEEMDTGSEVATFGSTAGSVSGVGSGWSRPVSRLSCPSSDHSNTSTRTIQVRSWYNEETWPYGGLRIKSEETVKSEPSSDYQQPWAKRLKTE